MSIIRALSAGVLAATLGFLLTLTPASARDMAFIEPGATVGSSSPDEAFKIEPKSEIDIGDSIINIVRRQTLFFVNQSSAAVKVEKVALSSDSTVAATIVNDDCSKQATLTPLSRCSIELSITPTGPGSWGIELLMTHDGPGRITRARITGKTAGSDLSDKRDRGLFLSTKDSKPVDFGTVAVGGGKIVRSALMVNDSPSPITIFSIDVIEADKTLQRLDQGCSPDMDLKPGESCPVTLVWTPTEHGIISTDLIIRHSGQLGFAVVPVRGIATGDKDSGGKESDAKSHDASPPPADKETTAKTDTAPPPSPADIAKEVAKASLSMSIAGVSTPSAATGAAHLIGTVGNRAVILKPDGSTAIVQVGDTIDVGGGVKGTVDRISERSATLTVAGKKKELQLEAVQELKDKAAAIKSADAAKGKNPSGSGGAGGSR